MFLRMLCWGNLAYTVTEGSSYQVLDLSKGVLDPALLGGLIWHVRKGEGLDSTILGQAKHGHRSFGYSYIYLYLYPHSQFEGFMQIRSSNIRKTIMCLS